MRQHVDFISAPHGEGIIIERDVPQQNFMFPFHARAAQKRLDVEQKLFAIKRRGQKIVYARANACLRSEGDSWLVNIKMRGSLPTLCSVWVNSSPFIPGIQRGTITRSVCQLSIRLMASSPLAASANRIVPGFQQVARFLPPGFVIPRNKNVKHRTTPWPNLRAPHAGKPAGSFHKDGAIPILRLRFRML